MNQKLNVKHIESHNKHERHITLWNYWNNFSITINRAKRSIQCSWQYQMAWAFIFWLETHVFYVFFSACAPHCTECAAVNECTTNMCMDGFIYSDKICKRMFDNWVFTKTLLQFCDVFIYQVYGYVWFCITLTWYNMVFHMPWFSCLHLGI